jgi:hypothetical protein
MGVTVAVLAPGHALGPGAPEPRSERKWTLATLMTAETPARDRLTLMGS